VTVRELIAERYQVEELIGTGGMSSVFRAYDTLLERRVALKVLHEQFARDGDYVERFGREARSVAQLSHPNIVTVIDRGEQDGRPFIVFEYVQGENLKEIVDREGQLPLRDALGLGVQIGRALAFAHANGLVHRDVKPQNVLLDEDGRARVTDFGIARSLDVEGLTITGTVLGTSNYIAPEQARGERVDAHTDIYSLGVVMYELLVGEVPYTGDTFVAVAMRHVNDPVPSVAERRPDVPPRIDWALQRAMAKRPDDRFETMDDFVAELEACVAELDGAEGQTVVAPPATAGAYRPPRRRRRGRVAVLLAIALLLAAAAAVGAYFVLRDSSSIGIGQEATAGPVKVSGVTAYDPEGTSGEHDSDAPDATDGDRASYWSTEHYESFDKSGVGLVLRTDSRPKRLRIVTDTPGFTARIESGSSQDCCFKPVSGAKTVGLTTTFDLSGSDRYLLVWIIDLGGNDSVHINEVRAS
jgi:eukaryotic-like serine/threonine-protein kinase